MKKTTKVSTIVIMVLATFFLFLSVSNYNNKKEMTPIIVPTVDDQNIQTTTESSRLPPEASHTNQKVTRLLSFIQEKMTGPYGVETNFLETSEDQESATGHEVLSESASFMMAIAVSTQMKNLFQNEVSKMQNTFDDGEILGYRYSPLNETLFPVNAAVDDLRIIRVLDYAADVFNDPSWHNQSQEYGKRFIQTNLIDNHLVDFYDSDFSQKSQLITLCYIDLEALKLLPLSTKKLDNLLRTQERILKEGYLSDAFPLYQTRYNYETKKYQDSQSINIIESLISLLHLVRQDQQRPETIEFIKNQTNQGKLYNRYAKNGTVLDFNQSTATYALVAIIAARLDDVEFYDSAITHMEKFQITNSLSPFYGAFGNSETQEFYSFDNLLALLAYLSNPSA